MASDTLTRPNEIFREPSDDVEFVQYKALSTSAIAGLVLGLLSFLAFFGWALGLVPMLGIAVSLIGIRSIKARPDELTGLALARTGFTLSLVMLLAGWGMLGYIYATEVPEGYTRITYGELQPDRQVRGQLVPPSALELDGKRVFIKGYMYPGARQFGIQEFILCRDRGDCCFGGNPKLTDRVKVNLPGSLKTEFSTRVVKVAGVFHVQPTAGADGLDGIYYSLDAEHLK